MAKKPSKKPGMNKERIKAELRILDGTMKAFAEKRGMDERVIRRALLVPQPRAEKVIAEALGTTPQALWPDRYTDDILSAPRHWRRHVNVSSPKSNTVKAARAANFTAGN